MKWFICREQNSIKTRSKNLHWEAIATNLLSKGLCISVTTLSLNPKLGTNTLRWCSYGMTLKEENQLSVRFLPFLRSTAKCRRPR